MEEKNFHLDLTKYLKKFTHKAYDVTENFPKSEIFGLTSQFRRAAISVALNYSEGYARQRKAVFKNFVETSYGSLKECQYLIEFCYERNYIKKDDFLELTKYGNLIGAMLWGIIKRLDNSTEV